MQDLWRTTEHNLIRAGKADAHFDLFRGVAIGDSKPLPIEIPCIYVVKRLGMSKDIVKAQTIWVALDANKNPIDLFGWLKLVPMR